MNKTFLNKSILRLLIAVISAAFVFSSCNEGLFNFNEETGNISLSFISGSGDTNLKNVVFTLNNETTGDTITKDCTVNYDNSGQAADCYISRANIGSWKINTAVYDSDGKLVAERIGKDFFELEFAQTVIVELEYFNGGVLDIVFEQSAGSDSLIEIASLDTLITGYHAYGLPLDQAEFVSVMLAYGSGLDTLMTGLGVNFPDGAYINYDGGWSRAVGNVEVETDSSSLTVTRADFASRGDFYLTLTDVNGTETEISDNCYFDFPPRTGLLSFTEDAYAGADIDFNMYEVNDSQNAGTYLVYIASQDDGSIVPGGTILTIDPSSIDPSIYSFAVPWAAAAGTGDCFVIVVTVDASLSAVEISDAYDPGTTDMSPMNIPGWLYINFGERINFVGISAAEYAF